MIRFVFSAGVVLVALLGGNGVHGHGHMTTPRSMNYDASINGAQNTAGVPPIDYCPHCLNTNTKNCGKNQYNDYDDFKDGLGFPMPWISVAEYTAGSIIDVESYLDTHHNGHMEIFACNDGLASSEECFDEPTNALHFVEDVAYGMPADPNYPERGYYAFGQGGGVKDFHMRFKLPDHIVGAEVLLQWRYITANSCSPPGYAEYFNGNSLPADYWTAGVNSCVPPYPNDGSRSNVHPEQFFNCARVTVLDPQPTSSPKPTAAPVTSAPTITSYPTPGPVDGPTWGSPSGDACCSRDFKECVSYCGTTEAECNSCNSDVHWLADGLPTGDCLAIDWDCSEKACCPGLTCVYFSENYSQCQYVDTPADPTPEPTLEPTPEPTPQPTPAPIVPGSTPGPTPEPTPEPTPQPTVRATPAPTIAATNVPDNCRYCCSLGGNGCPAWTDDCFTADKCGQTASCMWQGQTWVLECDEPVDDTGDDGGCCAQNGSCPSWGHDCFTKEKCGIDNPATGTWCSWGGALQWIGGNNA